MSEAYFRHLKINSSKNSVPRPVTLILSTDEVYQREILKKTVKNAIFTAFLQQLFKLQQGIF